MRIMIPLKNSKTNEIKRIKLGFSWTLFFFSPLFGIPLFMRGLKVWGGLMVLLWVLNVIAINQFFFDIVLVVAIVQFVIECYMGFRGNKLTALNHLENGWEFYEPETEFTKMAKHRWGIIH